MDGFRRRSSTGKSSYVDLAIGIIDDIKKSNGDIQTLLSNSLDKIIFNEIRSVTWRIFLGILSPKCFSEWVSKSKQLRKSYEEELEKISTESKFIDAEINAEEAQKQLGQKTIETIKCISSIVQEESKKSMIFNSLSESAQKIFLIWLKKYDPNNILTCEQGTACFKILLTLMFALYPSMLNVSAESCEIADDNTEPTPKEILYFLNSEDYFDPDIYWMYTELMQKGMRELITAGKGSCSNCTDLVSKICSGEKKGKQIAEELANCSRSEVDFVYYLGISDENLLKQLVEKKRDLSCVINCMISSLFYDMDYEVLIYFWDTVFACEHNSQFNFSLINKQQKTFSFLDFLACSLISKANPSKLLDGDMTPRVVYSNLMENEIKNVVISALKLREKVTNLYE